MLPRPLSLSTTTSWRPTKGTVAHGRFQELLSLLYPASKSTSFTPLPRRRRLFLRPTLSTPTGSCKRQDVCSIPLFFSPTSSQRLPVVARPCPPASGSVSPAFYLPLYLYSACPPALPLVFCRRASRADLHVAYPSTSSVWVCLLPLGCGKAVLLSSSPATHRKPAVLPTYRLDVGFWNPRPYRHAVCHCFQRPACAAAAAAYLNPALHRLNLKVYATPPNVQPASLFPTSAPYPSNLHTSTSQTASARPIRTWSSNVTGTTVALSIDDSHHQPSA